MPLRAFKVAFMAGAVERLDERFRAQRHAEATRVVGSQSLALATDAQNQRYIDQRFGAIGRQRQRQRAVDGTAYLAGRRRADDVSLSGRRPLGPIGERTATG